MKNSLSDLKLRIRNSEAQYGERLVALRRRYNMYATHRLHGGGSDIVIITPTHDKIQLFNGNKEAFVIKSLKLNDEQWIEFLEKRPSDTEMTIVEISPDEVAYAEAGDIDVCRKHL